MVAIPGFQEVMCPILQLTSNKADHRTQDLIRSLADEFQLSDSERQEPLPSGRQPRFANRVHWAVTYLAKAGLLDRTGRGQVRITPRGTGVLSTDCERLDLNYLMQFPEVQEFRTKRLTETAVTEPEAIEAETPEELLQSGHILLRKQATDDLLDRLKRSSPRFFELTVIDLLVAMGYGGSRGNVDREVGGSGDDGIDGIIREDKLGLDFVYVQAKRWEYPVGRPEVQAFSGSLDGQMAKRGVFFTTSRFTQDAKEFVKRIDKRIALIDGAEMAELMFDHDVGVVKVATYEVKKVNPDFFGDEA